VVVVGHVHRRYFRSGGATQSRTEVVVREVLPARQRAKVARALARAADDLKSHDEGR
jgi:single-strand DNA-binding protein